jgi:hypothetical protein
MKDKLPNGAATLMKLTMSGLPESNPAGYVRRLKAIANHASYDKAVRDQAQRMVDRATKKQNPLLQRALAALHVLTLTRGTFLYLQENDPKGLEQANNVICDMEAAGIEPNPRP